MKTLVEGMLPARFLTQHAVYMQTCAHIENVAWDIVKKAKQLEPMSPATLNHVMQIKSSNRKLLPQFRSCATLCNPGHALRILLVHDHIKGGLINRNAAAHGAWHLDTSSGKLVVEHYFQDFSKPKRPWMNVTRAFEFSDIDEAIEDADNILCELVDIRKTVRWAWQSVTTTTERTKS